MVKTNKAPDHMRVVVVPEPTPVPPNSKPRVQRFRRGSGRRAFGYQRIEVNGYQRIEVKEANKDVGLEPTITTMYNLNGKVALVTGAGGEHGISCVELSALKFRICYSTGARLFLNHDDYRKIESKTITADI